MATTIELTAISFVSAMIIGVVVASFRVSPIPPLRWVGTAYVDIFRNIPLAAQFVLMFFGLTKIGIRYDPFHSGLIVLSVYTSPFIAETIRSGINSVSAGQAEAARSLGLGFMRTLGSIVLPQAFRSVVGPLGGQLIALTKNSSLVTLISVADLTFLTDQLANDTAQPIPIFVGAAIGYFILTYPTGLLIGVVERRVAIKR